MSTRAADDSAGAAPTITSMRPAACLAMLRRHTVGRIAYTFRNRVDITPIHYVYSDGWLFARTSMGEKITTLRHVPWVAFEVDEVHGVFDWKSVVAHGTVYMMAPDGGPTEAKLWAKGMALLKRVVPETGMAGDPVPFRTVVFGVYIDTISGRQASSRRAAGRAAAKPKEPAARSATRR
jgi:nitroimidazol reductase NimA-like FMN-containing flavoprotein (pyridoxamine 5'-phosphate oxidase superfamily)